MDELHQDQPGTPGVDPATADTPPAPTGPEVAPASGAIVTNPTSSPSTVPSGNEHEAAPANDPGQSPQVASPSAVSEGYVNSRPLLMIGAAGDEVAELGYLLAEHGFENAISDGTAAAPPILDDALMRTVVEFQQANGIDPWKPAGDDPNEAPILRQSHLGIVDARTWEALLGYQPKVVPAGQKAEAV